MKIAFIFCILMAMTSLFTSVAAAQMERIAHTPEVEHALALLEKNLAWTTEQQIRITEIPAPPFQESQRASAVRDILTSLGLDAHLDATGNVIAERRGADPDSILMICAHLDTVFPAGTNVHVRHDGERLLAPGIADNGTGLAALAALARAFQEAKVRTRQSIVFAADVGEEGEGNLRGIRALVSAYRHRLKAVVAIDGAASDYVTTMALASRRLEVVVTGPGGHSWSDFGVPNPIDGLARGIVRFLDARAGSNHASEPHSTFNIGNIEGGTAVNAIPERAWIKVDLRSDSPAELDALEKALREAIAAGARAESEAAKLGSPPLAVQTKVLGERPGGELPQNAPLLEAVREIDRLLGQRSRLERSSTDANIPLSLGIPAISLGGGGNGGGAHSLNEWYDPRGRELGLKRLLLTIVMVAGLAK